MDDRKLWVRPEDSCARTGGLVSGEADYPAGPPHPLVPQGRGRSRGHRHQHWNLPKIKTILSKQPTDLWISSQNLPKKNENRSKKRDKSMQGEKTQIDAKHKFKKKSCQHCRLPREVHAGGCHQYSHAGSTCTVHVGSCTVHAGCHEHTSCRLPRILFMQVAKLITIQ